MQALDPMACIDKDLSLLFQLMHLDGSLVKMAGLMTDEVENTFHKA
jgi:hypothetical protein